MEPRAIIDGQEYTLVEEFPFLDRGNTLIRKHHMAGELFQYFLRGRGCYALLGLVQTINWWF